MSGQAAEVFFDESGHDGENLMRGSTPVFSHGSVHISIEEATEIVEYIRKVTRSQAAELKASVISSAGDEMYDYLFGPDGRLVGHAIIYLVEKENFAIGKIIDLLVEEKAYAKGINLHSRGSAKAMADTLYELGGRSLGKQGWKDLVSAFTSLMRAKQRKGGAKETVDGFFEKIDYYRLRATRQKVVEILALVWEAREHAEDFQKDLESGTVYKALDPLQASLLPLAEFWHRSLGQPISVVHDAQTALSQELQDLMLHVAIKGFPREYGLPQIRFPLAGIRQVDSKSDPRIQLADISAGFARQVSEDSLLGQAEPPQLERLRRILHPNPIWGPGRSWEEIRPE